VLFFFGSTRLIDRINAPSNEGCSKNRIISSVTFFDVPRHQARWTVADLLSIGT
jgi:hypothetical protein